MDNRRREFLIFSWFVAVMVLAGTTPQVATQTKPGCRSSCGQLNIPYPFGTRDGGSDCYRSEQSDSFVIFCDNSSDPPVAIWGDKSTGIPVDYISVVDHEIRIKILKAYDCYSSSGERNQDSPTLTLAIFPLSSTKNRFIVVGCDTYAYFTGQQTNGFSTGCMSLCNDVADATNGSCLGVGCCQTSFPRNMKAVNISLGSYYNHTNVHSFNPCSYAFVAVNDYFNFSTASLGSMPEERTPVALDWAIEDQTCQAAEEDAENYMCKENTNCTDADSGQGYRCHCKQGYQGNPYLSGPDGCQDIDECKISNPCNMTSLCVNLPGTVKCSCPPGFNGDGWKNSTGCSRPERTKSNSLEIGLGVGIGCLVLLLCGSWLAMGLRQRKATKERQKFFRDNGGLMLQQLLLSKHPSSVETLRVFTADELRKATDNYHESRILGQGGQGTVYKRIVMKDRTVAIKKAKLQDRSQVKDFINEIIVLSQINHKNVVKLIGCCLETELPLLVYEFVSNGTLFEHLHGNDDRLLSSWGARLRVAAETAGALSYLHWDAAIPIFHRDIKTANILLDNNYIAKVADFGASRLVPSDQTQLGTLVQGTFGYLDPKCFHSSELTDKSDVYSFGVVLAELLTGMKAIRSDKPEREKNLSFFFVSAVKDDRCLDIIDKRIINEGNAQHIREVARLASRCLKVRGEDRPSMKEVALELEGLLRATGMHPWANQDSYILQESECLLTEIHDMDSPETGPLSTISYSQDTMKSQLLAFNIAELR